MDFDKYFDFLMNDCKVPFNNLEQRYKDWFEKMGGGDQANRDFIWNCLNEVQRSCSQFAKDEESLYSCQKEISIIMLQFLNEENRNADHVIKSINFYDLMIAKVRDEKSRLKTEIEIIATKCCPECDSLDGIKLSIEKALAQEILPYSKCTKKSGCICQYINLATRDENGRLIPK